ncbi:hypothetical protein Acr_05g0009940 [Actinidia rufa]|uniref:Uncharacterized protein n=1 Tax=Actinidia rufa TaxID=165716 RepID=A0A7J0ELK8_9ERIC|nr:hypothetical protein Acr_05g0009940 [Actinidia rufa]
METTPCEILFSTAPTITGYSPDGNLFNYVSYISEISFHTHPSGDLAVIHGHDPLLHLLKGRSSIIQRGFERPRPGPLFLFVCAGRPLIVRGSRFGRSPSRNTWHGRTNEGHEREQRPPHTAPCHCRPQPPAAPSIPDVERSHHSNRSGGRSHNVSTERARGRRRAPSLSIRERSSSSESSQTRSRVRRGRSPRRGDHTQARDKSTSQRIRDLDARLNAINTRTNAPVTVDTLVRQTDPPFTERVLGARISSKFKLPTQLGIYEGKTDPMDHLDSYKSLMSLQGCSDESKADKYIAAEELAEAKRRQRGKDDHKRKEPDTRWNDYREETRYKRPDRDTKRSNNRRPRTPPRRPEFTLPPLNALVAQVLSEIKHEEFVKWPGKIKTDPQKRNRNKYCEFHRDHGHNTEDYFQLKEQIADLIKRGYLRKYVAARPPPNSQKEGTATTDQLRVIYTNNPRRFRVGRLFHFIQEKACQKCPWAGRRGSLQPLLAIRC